MTHEVRIVNESGEDLLTVNLDERSRAIDTQERLREEPERAPGITGNYAEAHEVGMILREEIRKIQGVEDEQSTLRDIGRRPLRSRKPVELSGSGQPNMRFTPDGEPKLDTSRFSTIFGDD